MEEIPFRKTQDGVCLFVRISPKASKNAVNGVMQNADGQAMLKVSVTAVPEKGKANGALIKLLSKEWKLAKSMFEISAGLTDRHKTLLIKGDGDALEQHLKEWMKQKNV